MFKGQKRPQGRERGEPVHSQGLHPGTCGGIGLRKNHHRQNDPGPGTHPPSGKLFIAGKDVDSQCPKSRSPGSSSPCSRIPYSSLNPRENPSANIISLPLRAQGLTNGQGKTSNKRVDEIMETRRTAAPGSSITYPNQLSGGPAPAGGRGKGFDHAARGGTLRRTHLSPGRFGPGPDPEHAHGIEDRSWT